MGSGGDGVIIIRMLNEGMTYTSAHYELNVNYQPY